MKRFFIPVLSVVSALLLSATALAVVVPSAFTDQATFAAWFDQSALKMKTAGVINGYADGSFGAANNVTRAELAVMLDKFALMMGRSLPEEPVFCTEEYAYGLNIILQDQNGVQIAGAQIGAQHNPGLPSDTSFQDLGGTYYGLGEAEGYYTITIKKAGYADHVETVKLEKDGCHVIPQTRTITLAKKLPQ